MVLYDESPRPRREEGRYSGRRNHDGAWVDVEVRRQKYLHINGDQTDLRAQRRQDGGRSVPPTLGSWLKIELLGGFFYFIYSSLQ